MDSSRRRRHQDFLVVIRKGPYCAGIVEPGTDSLDVQRKVRDISDGGVWNTCDGEIPEEFENEPTLVVACLSVFGWNKEEIQKALEEYQTVSDVMVT